jgi:REP element-mobilizing transposase RayT
VNGEFLLGAIEKEALRRMMWRMAKFSGVEILTYVIMDNHFHILLKVPEQKSWLKRFDGKEGEERFFDHLSLVYSKAFITQFRSEIKELRNRGEEDSARALLERFQQRFCDLSLFVKELKERFSRWYNKQKNRRGTLWMDRFKSVLVETGEALQTMAGYIDLNPVRAGLVKDPALYEWSGYGEAVGGSKRSRRGLCKVLDVAQDAWNNRAHAYYRKWLYGESSVSNGSRRKVYTQSQVEAAQAAVKRQTFLPLLEISKRMKSFSEGIAVGSEDYVRGVAAKYQAQFDRQRERRAKPLKNANGSRSGSIFVMRGS